MQHGKQSAYTTGTGAHDLRHLTVRSSRSSGSSNECGANAAHGKQRSSRAEVWLDTRNRTAAAAAAAGMYGSMADYAM
jgi:hypothetical protein